MLAPLDGLHAEPVNEKVCASQRVTHGFVGVLRAHVLALCEYAQRVCFECAYERDNKVERFAAVTAMGSGSL